MNKFAYTKVYKLVNNNDNDVYVGSTYQPLWQRLSGHISSSKSSCKSSCKSACKSSRKSASVNTRPVHRKIAELGPEHISIVCLECIVCTDLDDKRKAEQRWIDKLNPSLNVINSYTERKAYDSSYYKTNKERIARRKAQQLECPSCHRLISRTHMARHAKKNCVS